MKKIFICLIIATNLFLSGCSNNFDPYPYEVNPILKDSYQFYIFNRFYEGESGFYGTYISSYPIFENKNLEKPSYAHLFAGSKGNEIRLLGSKEELCNNSNNKIECSYSCNGLFPTIYVGTVTPIKPFVFKVTGEYKGDYSVFENKNEDFYLEILPNGDLFFKFNYQGYIVPDLNSEILSYTASYSEPDGIGNSSSCTIRKKGG